MLTHTGPVEQAIHAAEVVFAILVKESLELGLQHRQSLDNQNLQGNR
jgi:hypothetical protein